MQKVANDQLNALTDEASHPAIHRLAMGLSVLPRSLWYSKIFQHLSSRQIALTLETSGLTSKDIEVLQLLLLIVAVAALKKPQLADDVRYLQIIPTEGGELVSLTAEEADTLHDVHPLPCVNDCLG